MKGARQDFRESPAQSVSETPVFRVRLGAARGNPRSKVKSFIGRIKALVREQGGTRARRAHGGRGGSAAARLTVRASPQRVAIKTRIINHGKYASAQAAVTALRGEVAYLVRRSAAEDQEHAIAFDGEGELGSEDLKIFRETLAPDRHHFRIMVSPEKGAELDLRAFTREFVKEAETDLGTRLRWVGIAHYDTDNPHVHLMVRGKEAQGRDLVISRDYISHGMRLQAMEVATRRLGPRREEDIERSLQHELSAERITPLDRAIDAQKSLRPDGFVSALRGRHGTLGTERERIRLLARLQYLESIGLAREVSAGIWQPDPKLLPRLKALSLRGDIVKTIHARMTGKPWALDPLVVDCDHPPREPVLGRVIQRARVDEFWDHEYLLVDAEHGRALYVPLTGVKLYGATDPNVGSIVRIEAYEAGEGRAVKVTQIAPDLRASLDVDGVTWLDRELARAGCLKQRQPLAQGFEADYRAVLKARTAHLERLRLGSHREGRWKPKAGFLDDLYDRELSAADTRLAVRFGELQRLAEGHSFRGSVKGFEELPSGPHAVITGGGRYALVPAPTSLREAVGRRVTLTIGASQGEPTLAPRALQLSFHLQFPNRHRGIQGHS